TPLIIPTDILDALRIILLYVYWRSLAMNVHYNLDALDANLNDLDYLFIDISRLTPEEGYDERYGGYGTVRVSRLDSGQPDAALVAAKTIRIRDRHKRPERVAFRLARELKIWAGLRHPHVLPLIGYYLDKDYKVAILMSQYMAHGDLQEYIDRKAPSREAKLRLVCDVTDGLEYLHTRSPPIVHGDLKMKNVLISETRRGLLTDFGLSRTLEDEPTGLTTSDGFKGTLRFCSPELVRDQGSKHTLSSDMWAWGCLALEVSLFGNFVSALAASQRYKIKALAGIIPYAEKRAEHSIIYALITNQLPISLDALPACISDLKDILERCWKLEALERPSAVDCHLVLKALLTSNQGDRMISPTLDAGHPNFLPSVSQYNLRAASPVMETQAREDGETEQMAALGRQWDHRARKIIREWSEAGPVTRADRFRWANLLDEALKYPLSADILTDVEIILRYTFLLEEPRVLPHPDLTTSRVEDPQEQAAEEEMLLKKENVPVLNELVGQERDWYQQADALLRKSPMPLEDLQQLAALAHSVPVTHSDLGQINNLLNHASNIRAQAINILRPSDGRRTPIADAHTLVVTTQEKFIIPAVQILADIVSVALDIEKTCRDVLNVAYMPTSAQHKPLFERLRRIRITVRFDLTMLQLPNFDIIDQQLAQHDAWLEKVPWYRTPEPEFQGKLVVDDVVQNTRSDDDKPPVDPECTCICRLPVKVTVERQANVVQCDHCEARFHSKRIEGSCPFCDHHYGNGTLPKADAVQCDHCGAKFHSKCIEGSCPFCDHHHWNGTLPKAPSFDFVNLIPIAKSAPNLTRNYSLAWKHLDIIITCMDRFNVAIDSFLAKENTNVVMPSPATAIPQIRHFMRKLYKIQFSVQPRIERPSYGLTLCHLHRIMANNKDAQEAQHHPKFIFTAELFPPASDGSVCLCKGSHVGDRLITCQSCSFNFHGSCMRYDDVQNPAPQPWLCPMCMVRKGKQYPQCPVRVKTVGEQEQDVYVDTKACLENFSWQLIRQRLPPPPDYTISLELEWFVPGSNRT
ncbi:hypothetical protein FRB90_003316, partial [Tulasnella sp. 427]